jgi:outer membrane protein assembly factor BamB
VRRSIPSPPVTTVRRAARIAAAAVLVALVSGILAYAVLAPPPLEASSSGERYEAFLQTPLAESARRALVHPTAAWPVWGGTPGRTRFVPSALQPPFELLYRVRGRAMIELPPVVAEGRLVFGTHAGALHAVRTEDGASLWRRDMFGCIASSPAAGPGVVYVGWAGPAPCRRAKGMTGGIAAVESATGRVLWRFRTGNVESSPLLVRDRLFFAAFRSRSSSTVFGLRLHPRRVEWSVDLPTKVASSPALIGRTLFVAAYDRRVYAFDAYTGRRFWVSSALPEDRPRRILLGLRSLVRHASWTEAGYYATPAVAYGRVFVGSIDGVFSAFSARTGAHRWSRHLGGAVYGSAAVWNGFVYVGSTNGKLFALDVRTGAVRWVRDLGDRILGSPTVTNGNVYASTLDRQTVGLDARTGVLRWQFDDGQYSPLVHDANRAYVVGKGRIYAMVNASIPWIPRDGSAGLDGRPPVGSHGW